MILQCDNNKKFINGIIAEYLSRENKRPIHYDPRHS